MSELLKLCHAHGQAVVPQGGKTGKVNGCVASDSEFAISLERMNQILEVDCTARTLTIQAGATLQEAQQAAAGSHLLLPLDLGARGSATIGGNIATNAGGNRVIRYGMMRQLVLGLEAVLADGSIVGHLGKMLKDNAGYDLKQLFIGSEGTLGIVTEAVLRLVPPPRSQSTVLAACPNLTSVIRLLADIDSGLGSQLSAFEVMWQSYYTLATSPDASGPASPLPRHHPYYVLLETEGFDAAGDAAHLEELLANALSVGILSDAVSAHSLKQRDHFWAIRDNVGAYYAWQPVFAYDVSLPITAIEAYVDKLLMQISARWSGARHAIFGHLGDGNIHLAISVGDGSESTRKRLNDMVYGGLVRYQGSISAEHGIGIDKREDLHFSRSAADIALMRTLKQTLDPRRILNPGKVLGGKPVPPQTPEH